MIKCGLCGKEFEDDQFSEYATHVQKCAAEQSLKKKTEDMKKINEELEEVKRAKVVYEGLRDSFKEKYPDVYNVNFGEDNECKTKVNNSKDKSNTINHVTYDKNGKKYEDEVALDAFADIMNELLGLTYKRR